MSRILSNKIVDERLAKHGFTRLEEYKGDRIKIKMRCSCGREWTTYPTNAFRGHTCNDCAKERRADSRRKKNEIIEEHDDWVRIDISTPKHPNCYTDLDRDFWEWYSDNKFGRIYAWKDPSTNSYIYACTQLKNKKKAKLHALILDTPDGMEIDHKKHGTLNYIDNRRSNLRLATRSQNSINSKQSNGKSGITGVYFSEKRRQWQSYITFKKKRIHLGWFAKDDLEGAITARKKAEEFYFGEYAYNANN